MNQALPFKIAGLGRYLPQRVVPNSEVETRCGLPEGWIERKVGVRERRWIGAETNSYMGAEAAKEAVEDARMQLADIDLIINASGTQEQAIPDGAHLIQRKLGLGDSGVTCMSIHTTCLGFVVALDVSASLLATGRYRNILIIASDIGSVGINFDEPESASLFGDAAAAAVVTRPAEGEPGRVHSANIESYGDGAHLTAIVGGGTRRHPNYPDARPEDNLFHMEGPRIYKMSHRRLPRFLERLRPGLSKGLGSIKLVVPHQASMFALRSLRKYGVPDDRVVITIDRLGNCVAASIPVTLYEAVREGRIERGDEVLIIGTGAGLAIGGIILTY